MSSLTEKFAAVESQLNKYGKIPYDTQILPHGFFFKLLSRRGTGESITTSRNDMLSCWIPDTIVFNDDGETTPVWYFSNVQGKIVRTTQFSEESIVSRFSRKREDTIVAVLKKNPKGKSDFPEGTQTSLVSSGQLRGILTGLKNAEGAVAVLQRYVRPRGRQPHLIRAAFHRERAAEFWSISKNVDINDQTIPEGERMLVSFGDEKRRLESRVQRLKAAEEAVASAGEGGNPGALMEKAACAKVKRSDGIEVRGMSLKAGEECEAVLKRAVTFLRCYHGLCFDELVLDFLRDSAGLLWLLQIKAFKLKEDLCSKTTLSRMRRCSDIDDDDGLLNGRGGGVGGDEEDTEALEREERKAREGARLQRCGFCKCDFRAHELAWRMTPLTMLQTHDILRHIGRPLSWCDRDLACLAKITYDELYSVLQVCLSCYRLSAALQSLQAVEVEAASRLGVPVPHLLPEGLGTVRQKFETPPASVSQMKVRAQTAAERNRRPKQKTEFDTSSSEEEENRLGGGEGSGRSRSPSVSPHSHSHSRSPSVSGAGRQGLVWSASRGSGLHQTLRTHQEPKRVRLDAGLLRLPHPVAIGLFPFNELIRAFPCLARRGRPLSSSSAAALSSDSLPLHSTSPSPSPGSLTHPRPSSSGLVRHPPAPLVSSTPSLFPSRAFIQQQRQRGDPLAESSPVQRCGESENQTVGGEGVQTSVQGGTRVNLTRHPPPRPPSAPPERERVPSTGHMDPTGQKNKGHKGGPIEEENQNATADLLRAVIVDHHPSDGGQSKDEEAETTLLQMKYGTTTTPKQKKKPTAAIEASEDPFVVSEAPPLPFPPTSRALSPPAHFSLSAQGQQPHKDRDRDMGKPRGGPVDTVTNNCGVTEAQGQSARVVLRDVLCVETSMGELNGNKGPEFPFENTRGGGRERKKIEEEEQDEFSLVGGEFLWDLLHRHQNGTAGGLLRGHRDASTPAAHSLSPSLPRTVSPGRQTEKEEGRVSCLKQGAQVRVRGRRTVPDGDRQGIGGPLALLWKIWRGRKAAVQKRRSCLRVPAPPAMPFSWSLKMPISKSSPSLPSRGVKGKGREREEEGGGEGGDEEGRTNAGGKTFGRGSMGEWENERGTEANVVSTQVGVQGPDGLPISEGSRPLLRWRLFIFIESVANLNGLLFRPVVQQNLFLKFKIFGTVHLIPLGFHRPIVRRPPECGSACASSEASPCSQGKRTPFNRSGSRKPPHYFFLSGEEGQEGGGRGGRGSQSRPGSPSIPPSEARGQPADTKRPARTGEDPLSGEKNDASSPSSLHASLVEIKRKGIREAAQDQVASLRVNAPRVFWFFTPPGKEETARALKDLASKRDNLSVSLWLGPHKLGSRSVELGSLLKEGIGLSLSAACSSSSSSSPAAAVGGRGGKGGGGGGGSSGAGVGASEDSVLLSRSEGHFKGPNDVLSTALLRTQVGLAVDGIEDTSPMQMTPHEGVWVPPPRYCAADPLPAVWLEALTNVGSDPSLHPPSAHTSGKHTLTGADNILPGVSLATRRRAHGPRPAFEPSSCCPCHCQIGTSDSLPPPPSSGVNSQRHSSTRPRFTALVPHDHAGVLPKPFPAEEWKEKHKQMKQKSSLNKEGLNPESCRTEQRRTFGSDKDRFIPN